MPLSTLSIKQLAEGLTRGLAKIPLHVRREVGGDAV